MVINKRIAIEIINETTSNSAVCIVRCLEGTVSPGDVFDAARSADGQFHEISLRVTGIWRNEKKPTDLLDPPHIAKLALSGSGAPALPGFTHLISMKPYHD